MSKTTWWTLCCGRTRGWMKQSRERWSNRGWSLRTTLNSTTRITNHLFIPLNLSTWHLVWGWTVLITRSNLTIPVILKNWKATRIALKFPASRTFWPRTSKLSRERKAMTLRPRKPSTKIYSTPNAINSCWAVSEEKRTTVPIDKGKTQPGVMLPIC